MRFSRNPKTGILECYTDTGIFVGNMAGMGDMTSDKKQAKDAEVWRTTEEGHHIKLESGTGEIKAGFGGKHKGETLKEAFGGGQYAKKPAAAKPKRIRPESTAKMVSSVAGEKNLINDPDFEAARTKWADAMKRKDAASKRFLEIGRELKNEIEYPDDDAKSMGPQYAGLFGWYTEKGKQLKKEYDDCFAESQKAGQEAEEYGGKMDELKRQKRSEEIAEWGNPELKETARKDFEGFTLESDVPDLREKLKNGSAKVVEMSPKEYLERCAFEIFTDSTLENTVAGTESHKVNKYADLMENGEKFPIPYLDYATNNQEGRHRALAAMMNGYETMPVAIIGKEVGAGMREEPATYNPDPDPGEIESLKKRISGLSRFGEQGKLRKELTAKLESLTAKPEEPAKQSKKPDRPAVPLEETEDPGHPVTPYKEKQFEIVNAANPMHDDIHTGIRKPSDIMSPEEAFSNPEDYVYPDFTPEDGRKALESGVITLYSSYPIENGVFVTPSKMMAGDYAGEGQVYSKTVPVEDVAWINAGEGQFAQVSGEVPTLKEPTESFVEPDVNDPDFDFFEWLTNTGEAAESPEAAEARRKEDAERELERKNREERNGYGQYGLLESEYPEDLRLTDKEREAVFDVLHGYKDMRHKQKAGREVMNALGGLENEETLTRKQEEYQKRLQEAEEMILQRKEEGYSFGKTAYGQMPGYQRKKAWQDFVNEFGEDPGPVVGENGIRYWQQQRKQAVEGLQSLKLALKIAKRQKFAENSDKFVPWRKSENAENPNYRPWEKKAGDSVPATDEEAWRSTEEGRHFKLETTTGEIKAGFGGRFNGKKIGESWGTKKNGEPMQPKNPKPVQVTKPKKLDGWIEKRSPEEQEQIKHYLDGRSLGEFLSGDVPRYRKQKVLDMAAETTDWKDLLKERKFDSLNPREKDDINFLLDSFPWAEDPKFKAYPDETTLQETTTKEISVYYMALKAKALGVEGIVVPERPEELEYAMTHKPVAEEIASQNGGYVHTEAGNANRREIAKKLQAADSRVFADMPPEMNQYREAIVKTVENMDDRMAEMVNRALDHADVNWNDSQDTSNYLSGTITIYTKDVDGEPRSAEQITETFWHEFGHFVDDGLFSEARAGFVREPLKTSLDYGRTENMTASLMGNQRKMYHDAAQKDVESLFDSAGIGDKYGVKEYTEGGFGDFGKLQIYRKSDGKILDYNSGDEEIIESIFEIQNAIDDRLKSAAGYDEWKNFMRDHGEPVAPEYSDYVETYTTPKRHLIRSRERFPGATDAYVQAVNEHNAKKDAWIESIGGQDGYRKLLDQASELYRKYETKKLKFGHITDCLDDAVNGLFAMAALWGGHSFDYYRQKGAPVETTANIFSLRVRNDPDEVDFAEKVIPGITNLFTQAWRANYE